MFLIEVTEFFQRAGWVRALFAGLAAQRYPRSAGPRYFAVLFDELHFEFAERALELIRFMGSITRRERLWTRSAVLQEGVND